MASRGKKKRLLRHKREIEKIIQSKPMTGAVNHYQTPKEMMDELLKLAKEIRGE